jgi:hypothetical protein
MKLARNPATTPQARRNPPRKAIPPREENTVKRKNEGRQGDDEQQIANDGPHLVSTSQSLPPLAVVGCNLFNPRDQRAFAVHVL